MSRPGASVVLLILVLCVVCVPAVASVLDIPNAGAQVSFASALIENVKSLADAGWNGGRYASNWYSDYRTARSWTTSGGRSRLVQVLVAAHHPIAPLMDENALRREIQVSRVAHEVAWGDTNFSKGYFPAETCFSERMIPIFVEQGIEWVIVADVHISRACQDYPYAAHEDNCDPPNPADQLNPAQGYYESLSISRGVTVKTPPPFGFRPHHARYVEPGSGDEYLIKVVPAANAMSWNEGYGLYGTGEVDAIAGYNDPAPPMLILFAHDGDNAWSGGYSYYNENVTGFCHAAVSKGYEPTTIEEYLADHPVSSDDIVHVEDGGWVNADGDLDTTSALVASNGPLSLYADWDGEYFYVATEGVGSTPGWDHFVVLGVDLSTPVSAPWAQSGTVADQTLYLGNEDSNNWCGWFDESETLLSDGVESASGSFLEGLVRLETYLGSALPDGVYLAVAAYQSPDGGSLSAQAPSGNGDNNVEAAEYVYFPLGVVGVEPGEPAATCIPPAALRARPNPFSSSTNIEFYVSTCRSMSLEIYDVRGRRVRTLSGVMSQGAHPISWDGRDDNGLEVSSGVYVIRLHGGTNMNCEKVVFLR